jgi:hypothetical protein
MPIDDEDDFDLYGDEPTDELPDDVAAKINHLRDTLTHDMALRIIPNRFGVTPEDDEELEQLMEELIADAFNDGYDSWDEFPY